jgi:hypothetical protein
MVYSVSVAFDAVVTRSNAACCACSGTYSRVWGQLGLCTSTAVLHQAGRVCGTGPRFWFVALAVVYYWLFLCNHPAEIAGWRKGVPSWTVHRPGLFLRAVMGSLPRGVALCTPLCSKFCVVHAEQGFPEGHLGPSAWTVSSTPDVY